ncbi:MAG: MgtC/SapB family protein, partial [Acidaminococcaceae bacterium]
MLDAQDWQMLMRLFLAALLGGIVGIERGSGDRPAGLRTHILVCTGSALIMLVSIYAFAGFEGPRDPGRLAAQVVSGIGFLGAGTILHEGMTVRGLTTAASLWMVAAIGLAIGGGMIKIGIASTVIMLITLVTFHGWEKRFGGNSRIEKRYIRVVIKERAEAMSEVV